MENKKPGIDESSIAFAIIDERLLELAYECDYPDDEESLKLSRALQLELMVIRARIAGMAKK